MNVEVQIPDFTVHNFDPWKFEVEKSNMQTRISFAFICVYTLHRVGVRFLNVFANHPG